MDDNCHLWDFDCSISFSLGFLCLFICCPWFYDEPLHDSYRRDRLPRSLHIMVFHIQGQKVDALRKPKSIACSSHLTPLLVVHVGQHMVPDRRNLRRRICLPLIFRDKIIAKLDIPAPPANGSLQIVLPLKESQFPSETAGEGNLTLLISSLDGDQFFRVATHGHAAGVSSAAERPKPPFGLYRIDFDQSFRSSPLRRQGPNPPIGFAR